MSIPRSLRRLVGATTLAIALTTGLAAGTAAPAQAAANPAIGSAVCHVSPVGGLRCGTVNAVNLTISFPDGVIHGAFRYSACSFPGDAGLPVYQLSTGQPIGTVLGGSGCQTYGLPS